MRRLPKGIEPHSLPDVAHFKGHGIEGVKVWCHTPLCYHQRIFSFSELERYGVRDTTRVWDLLPHLTCTRCGERSADLQPDWSRRSEPIARASDREI